LARQRRNGSHYGRRGQKRGELAGIWRTIDADDAARVAVLYGDGKQAFEVANKLAFGSQTTIRWIKYARNNWLRMACPAFDTSLALEFMGFAGPDMRAGAASLREKAAT
jgi:enoyl-CoA hydratase/carnithine racemase